MSIHADPPHLAPAAASPSPEPVPGSSSPWGRVQHVERLRPGVVFVSTPSHGGLWLSEDAQPLMPDQLRPRHGRAWWEEDVEIQAPLLVLGLDDAENDRDRAIAILAAFQPDWLDALAAALRIPNAAQVRRIRELHGDDGPPDLDVWRSARADGAVEGRVGGVRWTISAAGEAIG
jgi:hypothetical protein